MLEDIVLHVYGPASFLEMRPTLCTEVDTKSPGRQGLCAKISDNAPPERLPRRDACISFGTVPRVPISALKERF